MTKNEILKKEDVVKLVAKDVGITEEQSEKAIDAFFKHFSDLGLDEIEIDIDEFIEGK